MKKYFGFLVILIIFIGIGLRLYKLSDLFHFTYDEEIFAFVGKRMFLNNHIPLIGGVTPMHVHVAPYFYWLSGVLLFLFNFNPLGWGIYAAFLSGITLIILYKTTNEIFDRKTGLIAVFLYSFSFMQNIFDRHWWGLVFDGLISVIVLFSLNRIINKHEKYFYLLCAFLAFGFHTDLSILTLFIFSIIAFLIFKIRMSKRVWITGFLIFFISFLPLIWFDLRHNFANSRGIIQYWEEIRVGKKGNITNSPRDILLFVPRTLIRSLYVFGDTDLAKQYSYCSEYSQSKLKAVPDILSISLLLIFVYILFYKNNNVTNHKAIIKLIKIFFISIYSGIIIYGVFFRGDLFEHYLATIYPIFFILSAYFLKQLLSDKNMLLIIVMAIYIVFNIRLLLLTNHTYGYSDRIKAIDWSIVTLGNNDFALDVVGDCFKYNGFRYLYYFRGHEPVKSYVDANFTHLYDYSPNIQWPKYVVVITNPDFTENETYKKRLDFYKSGVIAEAKFNKTEVLIVDNTNLKYVGDY